MKKTVKSLLCLLLALCLVMPGVVSSAAAVDLGLTWPATWLSGTAPAWAQNASAEEKTATIKAINDEYNAQLDSGYNLGGLEALSAYGNQINAQFSGADSDNIGNPWGHTGRKWGLIMATYSGVAFSVKGYFAASFGSFRAILGNEFSWTDPETGKTATYQLTASNTMVVEDGATVVNTIGGAPAAATLDSSVKAPMQEAIARLNYSGFNIGFGAANSGDYNGYTYQEFFGPDSTGASAQADRGLDKNYGISYVVGKGNEIYFVTGDMFTAWAEGWGDLNTTDPDRFSYSGVPTSNAYTDGEGNLCQDFEKITIVLSPDGEKKIVNNASELIYIDGDAIVNATGDDYNIYLLVSGSISAVKLEFAFSEGATANVESGSSFDLSSPLTVTVTGESGATTDYTITAYAQSAVKPSDKRAPQQTEALISVLPDYIFTENLEDAKAAIDSYDALTTLGKLLISPQNALKLYSAMMRIETIGDGKIRITCVGDSITEGIGASSGSANYPSQLQKKLGDGYVVTNAGVSGSFASEQGCWLPYITTDRYATGLNSNPDLVFMMHGTNDAWSQYWNSTAVDFPALFEEGYRNLIERYLALPSQPKLVLCLPMTCYNTDDGRETNNVNGTIPIIKKLAEEYGLDILDMHSYTADHANWFGDKLHPNDFGYDKVSDKFVETVNGIMANNTVNVTGIKVGDTDVDNFNADTSEYTVKVKSYDFPEIAVESNNCKVTATVATRENPVSYIFVEPEIGHEGGKTYVIVYDTSEVVEVKKGDIDGDGKVTVSDVVEIRKLIMSAVWTENQLAAGDFDENNTLTVSDVVSLRSYIMSAAG